MRNSIVALALLCTTSAFAQAPSVDDQTLDAAQWQIVATVQAQGDTVRFIFKDHAPFSSEKDCLYYSSTGEAKYQKDSEMLLAKVKELDPKGTVTFKCEKVNEQ